MPSKLVISAALWALLLIGAAPAGASEEARRAEWQGPTGDRAVHELTRELETLIGEAESANAADPQFLQDIKDAIADRMAALPLQLPTAVRDDFSDGDFSNDPRWIVVSSAFSVDSDLGLRSVVRMPQAAARKPIETIEDLAERAKGTLDDILGAQEDVDVPEPAPEVAEIFTRAAIGNAFSLGVAMSSRIALYSTL